MATRRKRRNQRMGLIGLVAFTLTAAAATSRCLPPPPPLPAARLVVQPGDTLWVLAGRCRVPGADRRELVWVLQQVNGLRAGRLLPGQALLVPLGPAAYKSALSDPQGFQRRAVVQSDPPASYTWTRSR